MASPQVISKKRIHNGACRVMKQKMQARLIAKLLNNYSKCPKMLVVRNEGNRVGEWGAAG